MQVLSSWEILHKFYTSFFIILEKKDFESGPVFLGAVKTELAEGRKLKYDNLHAKFGSVWIDILKYEFSTKQYKQALLLLDQKVRELQSWRLESIEYTIKLKDLVSSAQFSESIVIFIYASFFLIKSWIF